MRRLFALAVVVVHVLLLWVLITSIRREPAPYAAEPVYTRLWLNFDSPPPVEPAPANQKLDPQDAAQEAIVPEPLQQTPVVQESAANAAPEPPAVSATSPDVDWRSEGKLAARRAAKSAVEPQQHGFSPEPKTIRKPCVPRKSSMEWKGEEDRKVRWDKIIPVFKIGNCMVTIGAFACSLGEPEVNGHLLDDMRSPDRSPSSVPDPNICD
jgi:hypothetical protein